ncbi:MAG: NAD-dependent epimerase/dehydratase family protein, partial [Chloroflexi bacterium]|nr:NAD-dependent epimerase/dehydratase family protein [Chloroflexota bacterium]
MKALVTGGAGFIGSHLCGRLLDDGWSVTCMDNFASGSRRNVSGLLEHPRFEMVERDISAAALEADFAADRYYQMASPASPNPHTPRSYMA